METLLGIPSQGWIAISIWLMVLILPWTYVLYFLRQIDRSGVERWGGETTNGDGSAESNGSAQQ